MRKRERGPERERESCDNNMAPGRVAYLWGEVWSVADHHIERVLCLNLKVLQSKQ